MAEVSCRYLMLRGRLRMPYCPVRQIRKPTREDGCGTDCPHYKEGSRMPAPSASADDADGAGDDESRQNAA